MRIWTIGISLALAGILHLDAIALLKRLSEDSTLRSGLVARAQQVMQQTENIIGSSGATNVFQSAVQQLRQRHPEATRNLTDPPPLPSQEMAKLWLSGQVRGQSNAPQLLVEYQQIVSSNIVARAPELMGSVSLVHDDLTAAGLELWPDYSKIDGEDYLPTKSAFWGMLATAALLSLGAPFWFHGLKTLTNLRPMVAAQVQKEVEGKADPKH
jgi:hypothetical protein